LASAVRLRAGVRRARVVVVLRVVRVFVVSAIVPRP
jgi:hypothetical protein